MSDSFVDWERGEGGGDSGGGMGRKIREKRFLILEVEVGMKLSLLLSDMLREDVEMVLFEGEENEWDARACGLAWDLERARNCALSVVTRMACLRRDLSGRPWGRKLMIASKG